MSSFLRRVALLAIVGALVPAAAQAGVQALQPYPTNLLTVPDATQVTGLRIALPTAGCAPADCNDLEVIDRLDGFNVQPRVSIPFSAPIDLGSVSDSSVYLRRVGCFACPPVGLNQVEWEPLTNTLHGESDQLLAQDATYLLVVTTGVRSTSGTALDRTTFLHDLNFGQTKDAATKAYRKALKAALDEHDDFEHAAAASLFTTQSITADLDKIRHQIDASTPAPPQILRNQPVASLLAIQWNEQITTAPSFATSLVPTPALQVYPGSVASVAWGTYASPNYETTAQEIPATGTRTGVPAVQSTSTLQFELFVPSGAKPAAGWPVAIFGHGFTDSKQGAPWAVASSLAHAGIASIAIDVVGHGGGSLGTLTLLTATGPVVIPDGGRAFDQDGNGFIGLSAAFPGTEGINAAHPIVATRDTLRQTVVDLMQLVREVQVGIDVDGDHLPDLDRSRITYAGQSFGGIYGVDLLAVEPDIAAGVANVPGGSIPEVARLGAFRGLVGLALLQHGLYNAPPNPTLTSFVENIPLRDLPTLVDVVPGASAIQENLDRNEWVQNSANPAALAPYLRHSPLPGHAPKPVIIQFAKGDGTVPNPTTTAILRAGALADRATYFRNDIAGAGGTKLYSNPHTFLTGIGADPLKTVAALEAQAQIAAFLGSLGALTIDPDGPGPVFEVPIAGPLPEGTNF